LGDVVRVVRVSSIHETVAVDAPADSPPFFNLVLIGTTLFSPVALLAEILAIEKRLGRVRRGVRNEPRIIDIDLILHGATRMRTRSLTLPHPRAREREFVMKPLREIAWNAGVLAGWLGAVSAPFPVSGGETPPGQPAGRRRSAIMRRL
jgi:2-amino-4-hydroxy-6-hydroxymethyldihydropteridine diphosphokinase